MGNKMIEVRNFALGMVVGAFLLTSSCGGVATLFMN
jgi:hypothetical protein